ncbi:hypothetical protein [Gemmatimonas sp. UBA7669]|uniref:hypothetical protein n=1 Tax=Gemmatimonas sp. UBA7669 TaxID=1946568 RepID=UPI0025BC76D5|nr:hypothetical protein [Gemmatimonas sp. UBA7669]
MGRARGESTVVRDGAPAELRERALELGVRGLGICQQLDFSFRVLRLETTQFRNLDVVLSHRDVAEAARAAQSRDGRRVQISVEQRQQQDHSLESRRGQKRGCAPRGDVANAAERQADTEDDRDEKAECNEGTVREIDVTPVGATPD